MSKAIKMDEKEAEKIMAHLAKFVNAENYEFVNDGLALTKKIIDVIMLVLQNKYQTRHGLSGDDCKITFDPSARTQLLIVMRMFYVSVHESGLECDAKVETYAKNFDIKSIEYQLWTWFAGIVASTEQKWDMLQMIEIPKEIEAISLLYSKNKIDKGEEPYILDTHALAQVCFIVFVEVLVDKIANLYWDPSETGSATRGTVIKGAHLSGIFRIMNIASANPEIFLRIYNAASAFPIIKKGWVETAKAEKKKAKDLEKAAKDKKKAAAAAKKTSGKK